MVATVVVVAVSANSVPGMSATIGGIEGRTSVEEVVAVWIAGIDAEVPESVAPVEWTEEIGGCAECLPLPVEQDIAQVQVATLPIGAEYVIVARHAHQIVEVDFVGSLVLRIRQVQFVSHLVGQEESLVPCLFVAHGLARCCYRQHCY